MSSMRLAPTLDLVHRVNEAALTYTTARMNVLEQRPDNPIGVDFRTAGHATALMAKDLPSASFNSVIGLHAGEAEHIAGLIRHRS